MLRPRIKIQTFNRPALPLEQAFAKTRKGTEEEGDALGQTVLVHALLTGWVAQALIESLPAASADWIPKESALLAACHDVGKITPCFQEKIRRAVKTYVRNSLEALKDVRPEIEAQWGYHSGAGRISAGEWSKNPWVGVVIGCHHGYFPRVGLYGPQDEVLGGPEWMRERSRLVEILKQSFKCGFPEIKDALQARVLAGLTTISDWISSGIPLADLDEATPQAAKDAAHAAGGARPQFRKGLSFSDVFGFEPNAVQTALASRCTRPGVFILEAPMGVGKTEAALFAAYQLISTGQASGFYFALPSQVTSDAIWLRVNAFLSKVLDDDAPTSAQLVHSRARLALMTMGADAAPGGQWFSSSRRALLAPFGVGTIDQALMAVMAVRFSTVRTFALLGKVVIIDEVHTYDMYTGTILDALVQMLRELGCTVIILSATLTMERRSLLLRSKEGVSEQASSCRVKSSSYPLLTSGVSLGEVTETSVLPPPTKTCTIRRIAHSEEAVEQAIERARRGEQVLWIENTVPCAQSRYEEFCSRLRKDDSLEVGICHSRFTAGDRQKNERKWVSVLGKDGARNRSLKGRILVGTQVLEQSLDIDADFLVTQVCPTDMLLQRIGRLWRRDSTLRPSGARREAWILMPDSAELLANPKEALGPSARVYAPYVLCRTVEVWEGREQIRLPDDMRALIEETYAPRPETGVLQELFSELEEGDGRSPGRRQLQQLARLSLSEDFGTMSDDESEAPTRFGSIPTVDVLLCRELRLDAGGHVCEVRLFDGERIPLNTAEKPTGRDRVSGALAILRNCVRVPARSAPPAQDRANLAWLSPYAYISRTEGARIRVARVDDDGRNSVLTPGTEAGDQLPFEYTQLGYRRVDNKKHCGNS